MNKLAQKFVMHPIVVAINEDSLGRWICRIFGHRWAWPEFTVAFDFERGLVEVSQETHCVRCGYRNHEGYPELVVHVKNLGDSDVVGEQVKRQMGWN